MKTITNVKEVREQHYNNFKMKIEEKLVRELPQYRFIFGKTAKNNTMLDSITILNNDKNNNSDNRLAPTIYTQKLYEDYCDFDLTIKDVIEKVKDTLLKAMKKAPTNEVNILMDKLKDLEHNVYPMVCCTKTNADMLDSLIHREFLDLSIYYNVFTILKDGSSAKIRLSKDMLDTFNVTEEQLYAWSIKNLTEKNNYAMGMFNQMKMLMFELQDDVSLRKYSENDEMIVVTNEEIINGANNILNTKFLNEIANNINSDFYILPSSIHEIILVPTKFADKFDGLEDILNMVKDINETKVETEDRLSDTLYMYTRDTNKVTVVQV